MCSGDGNIIADMDGGRKIIFCSCKIDDQLAFAVGPDLLQYLVAGFTTHRDGFTAARNFPLGTAVNFLPVTLTPASAMDYLVSVFEGATIDGTPGGALVSALVKDESVDA